MSPREYKETIPCPKGRRNSDAKKEKELLDLLRGKGKFGKTERDKKKTDYIN